jgi:hypothetical protein
MGIISGSLKRELLRGHLRFGSTPDHGFGQKRCVMAHEVEIGRGWAAFR